MVGVDAQKEEKKDQGAAADGEVDVKDPSPAGTFNEGCEEVRCQLETAEVERKGKQHGK